MSGTEGVSWEAVSKAITQGADVPDDEVVALAHRVSRSRRSSDGPNGDHQRNLPRALWWPSRGYGGLREYRHVG